MTHNAETPTGSHGPEGTSKTDAVRSAASTQGHATESIADETANRVQRVIDPRQSKAGDYSISMSEPGDSTSFDVD